MNYRKIGCDKLCGSIHRRKHKKTRTIRNGSFRDRYVGRS